MCVSGDPTLPRKIGSTLEMFILLSFNLGNFESVVVYKPRSWSTSRCCSSQVNFWVLLRPMFSNKESDLPTLAFQTMLSETHLLFCLTLMFSWKDYLFCDCFSQTSVFPWHLFPLPHFHSYTYSH